MREKKENIIISFLFFGVLVCFYSCASASGTRENRPYAYLTDDSRFFLLPPEEIDKPIDMAQQISASFDGGDYFLNAWVMADQKGMDMILLNELGVNMGELSYRDGAVSFSSLVFPNSLRPEYIIADFQLCFYKDTALRQALDKCGLSLESTMSGRRVYQKRKLILEIENTGRSVKFTNHLRGYTYTLEGDFGG